MTSMSPEEIRKKGLEALFKALGPSGMVKFLEQYATGEGDYTKERQKWLDNMEIDDIVEEIEKERNT